jgi:hormone-sensitive lipase
VAHKLSEESLRYANIVILDVNPEDIVLVGDSAGGNIITALTGLLIKLKQKLPAGLVLIYPTLNLTFNSYSPSLLASLDDCILPHTYLKFCLSSYIPENRRASDDDPFASPIKFGDEILKHFPPTRMFIGNKDPFHDDNCRLA